MTQVVSSPTVLSDLREALEALSETEWNVYYKLDAREPHGRRVSNVRIHQGHLEVFDLNAHKWVADPAVMYQQ